MTAETSSSQTVGGETLGFLNVDTDVCLETVWPFPEFIDPEQQQTSEDQTRFKPPRFTSQTQPERRLQRHKPWRRPFCNLQTCADGKNRSIRLQPSNL